LTRQEANQIVWSAMERPGAVPRLDEALRFLKLDPLEFERCRSAARNAERGRDDALELTERDALALHGLADEED
jgi:hypothetical protein